MAYDPQPWYDLFVAPPVLLLGAALTISVLIGSALRTPTTTSTRWRHHSRLALGTTPILSALVAGLSVVLAPAAGWTGFLSTLLPD